MGWKEWKEGSQKEAGTQRRDQEREGGRKQKVSEGQEDEQK